MSASKSTPIFVRGDETLSLSKIKFRSNEISSDKNSADKYDERWIQRLIHQHPECLPIDEMAPDVGHLVSVCMELPIQIGIQTCYLDNLLLTTSGNIVLAEVKLWRNPEARRKVVAQALDYAAGLFQMSYSEIQDAWRKTLPKERRNEQLYNLMPESDTLDEVTFIDTVNLNLKKGRILVLVVGDGIRSEVETLVATLQSHAGFHFTFGLIEMAVFTLPDGSGQIVCPRSLLKTNLVERGIVQIDDQRVVVKAVDASQPLSSSAGSITAQQFMEKMADKRADLPNLLGQFLAKVADLGVEVQFMRSLNLKWQAPSGKAVNFGYIKPDGEVWTEAMSFGVEPKDIARQYNVDLALLFGGTVAKMPKMEAWYVKIGDKGLRVERVADKLDGWYDLIAIYIEKLRQLSINQADSE